DFSQGHFVYEMDLPAMICHVHLYAALGITERHDGAHVFLWHEQCDRHNGLTNVVNLTDLRHARGAFDHHDFAVSLFYLIHHRRRGGNDVHTKFALQALLHNLHVQQAQEPAAKAKAQRLRDLGLEHERGVVKLQLFQGVTQLIVFAAFDRVNAGEDLRFDFFEDRQCMIGGFARQSNRVTYFGVLEFLDTGDHEAHFTCRQLITGNRLGRKHPYLFTQMRGAGRHQQDFVLRLKHTIHDAHQHHHAHVVIKP